MLPQKAVGDGKRSEMMSKKREHHEVVAQKAVVGEREKPTGVYYKEFDLYEVVECLLNCLEHISEKYFYGIGVLVDVVRGSNRKQIQQGKLMNVPEYNSYPEMSKDDLWAIVMWLIDKHYMLRTKEYYKKLHPTYEGRHFQETLTVKMLQELKAYLEAPEREVVREDERKGVNNSC